MTNIVMGTTPTITYTFSTVSVANISTAILTIKKDSQVVIEKELTDATIGQNTLSWTLTQADTLQLTGFAEIMLNWKTADGTRGASDKISVSFETNHIKEVI